MHLLPLSILLDVEVPIQSLSLVADNPKSQLHPVSLKTKPQLPGCPPPLVGSTASPPIVSKSRKRANSRSRIAYQAKDRRLPVNTGGSLRLPKSTRYTSIRRSESYNDITLTNPRSKASKQRSPPCGTDINDRWSSTTNSLARNKTAFRRIASHDGLIHMAMMSTAAVLPADQRNGRWASNSSPSPPPSKGFPHLRRSRKPLRVEGRAPSSNTMSLQGLILSTAAGKKSPMPALRKPVRKSSMEFPFTKQEDGIPPPPPEEDLPKMPCPSSPVRLPVRRKSREQLIGDVLGAALDSTKSHFSQAGGKLSPKQIDDNDTQSPISFPTRKHSSRNQRITLNLKAA